LALCGVAGAATPADRFHRDVSPIIENYCYDCHGDGASKGKVAFDELSDADLTGDPDLWFRALKNVRAGIMPPLGKPRPTAAEQRVLADWIKAGAFGIDPADPDPGRVTIRRMNRVEYGRTVKSLLGVDYPSEAEFPPDDTGNGFDNIADVLSMSPMLLEKYLQAAEIVISGVVPQTSRITPVLEAKSRDFLSTSGLRHPGPLPFTETAEVKHGFTAPRDADYRLVFDLAVKGPFNFDPTRCRLTVRVDGTVCLDEDLGWSDSKPLKFERDEAWRAGFHEVSVAVTPLVPAHMPSGVLGPDFEEKQRNEVVINSVEARGPLGRVAQVAPPGYARFFPAGEPPMFRYRRDRYARDILRSFATRAFRRPVDEGTLDRLVALERRVEEGPGGTFEVGVSRAMMAVLSSPRFIFRMEEDLPADRGLRFPRIDEYSLASRLSYFLWSTMPDDALYQRAAKGELRANLHGEVLRMLADPRSEAFVRNFTGQWLQARDVETVPINARTVLGLGPHKPGDPRVEFEGDTRRAMRSETEMCFSYVVHADRSVLELVDGRYTFLNEELAKIYGVPGVAGEAMRRVELPESSYRGGVLTEGTMLTVTSNPTRTSPVKRGQFVLENILGTPTPPPPPNIPALEEQKSAFGGREPTLKEMLARHRADKLCSSCHARMDPLGLAFENFNALGNFREKDAGQPVEAAGRLITGENFADVRELKRLITHERREDFYRCITEKLLTYALGRGLEYYDVETVDRIVAALDADGGHFSTLLMGVVDSAPFQKRRTPGPSRNLAQVSNVLQADTPH
jgi:hypothetical protein